MLTGLIRRWLGRLLLRPELELAKAELAHRLEAAQRAAHAGETYAIGKIDGLRSGAELVSEVAGGGDRG